MSVSSEDLAIPISGSYMMAVIGIGAAALVYFSTLKVIFGTFSIRKVIADYQKKRNYSERYNELFQTRENFMYHISWAKSRGNESEAKSLMDDLKALDKEIDEFERKYFMEFGDKRKSK